MACELFDVLDIFMKLVRNSQRILTEIVAEIIALVHAVIGIGRQLSVGRNPVCRIAVLIHLKIAENPIHPGDKAVAEGVIIFVNRQPCYCGSQPQRKLNIRLGFRTEEHSLVLRTLIKI